jgi:hypothetical protein
MILEDATFEAFGYYARNLKPKSGKLVIAACDECGKVRETSKNAYLRLCGSCVQKGRIHTEETKVRKRAAHTGEIFTEERKANMSAAMKGNTNALGYKHTKEAKELQSAAMKGENNPMFGRSGENNPNWRDGISFEPYCVKFNNGFKEYIRAKFGYKCFLCPTTQEENGQTLSVHHVNYNKNCGCDGDKTCNFVPLCVSCHSKTNFDRAYWQKRIADKLHCLIIGWNV